MERGGVRRLDCSAWSLRALQESVGAERAAGVLLDDAPEEGKQHSTAGQGRLTRDDRSGPVSWDCNSDGKNERVMLQSWSLSADGSV